MDTKKLATGVFSAIGLLAAAGSALAAPELGENPGQEPGLNLTVKVDGASVAVVENATAIVKIGGKDLKIEVDSIGTRTLQAVGVSFDYPSEYLFAYSDTSPDTHIWSVTGAEIVVSVNGFTGVVAHYIDTVYESMSDAVANIEPADTKVSECKLQLGKETILGRRVDRMLSTDPLRQEFYLVPVEGGKVILTLQDTLTPEGKTTDEYKRVVKMLEANFKYLNTE